ncbi:MAG TPA: DUF2795 domain-containing protein [Deltaproteobacteria bacterium]|nr:DUF2795 domain-containing protein [Deltaproteobacteria bacterium]HOI06696.1 DUF2795 domain-containing protein [Deltaproteobacteria bacterium]
MGVSTVDLKAYLEGVDYPSRKGDLIQKAQENQAPRDVIDLLIALPDWEYHSIGDISRALGESR